ncbi:spermidine/putrescine ABC transporter substrate-binding protein [Pseudaeromonas sp. ZJS20]|uniref:ABC transporter substrate-binding protein n=1 Tax=Pseudaeromonas aegiceratis TaxID=3153928 RepID=UPI00390C61A7
MHINRSACAALLAVASLGAQAEELHLYNWTIYIDPAVVSDFEKETGIKTTLDNYGNNEEMLAKIQAGAQGYDIVFPSVFMQDIMTKLGLLQSAQLKTLKGYDNLGQQYFLANSDPDHEICMPYNWGTTGLIYNKALTQGYEVNSWKIVFDPPKALWGKIAVLDDVRETIGAALVYNGFDFNSTNPKELATARDTIKRAKPHWAAMLTDGIGDKVINGDFAVAQWWSGSAAQTVASKPDAVGYAIPKEGANGFQEDMCLLASSQNVAAARKFFEYMMRPEVAAKNANWLFGGTPNTAALPQIAPALGQNPDLYPSDDVRKRLFLVRDLGDKIRLYDAVWTSVKAD